MENKWIKFEKALATGNPKVLRIASRMRNAGVTPESLYTLAALGALTRLWSFADSHIGQDNTLPSAIAEVNEVIGIAGFCDFLPPEWFQVLDGNRVHLPDFLEHNGIKARTRALAAGRQKRYRQKHNGSVTVKSHKSNGTVTHPALLPELPKTLDQKTIEESPLLPPNVVPIKKPRRARKDGSRLPADFELTAARKDFAESLGLQNVPRIFADFCDYWVAKPGANGCSLDWQRTWYRWCRKALDMQPPQAKERANIGRRDEAAWAEAHAAAKAIGFRAPGLHESVGAYMTDIKLTMNRVPKFSVTAQLQQRAQQR